MTQRGLRGKAQPSVHSAILARGGMVLLDPERSARAHTSPDDTSPFHQVGRALLTAATRSCRGQAAAAAVEVFRVALARSDPAPASHNGLGAALVERARFESAAASVATLSEALGEFETASDKVGRSAAARAARLRYDINRAMALWMLGERTADVGRLGQAVSLLRAAIEMLPASSVHWPHVQDTLGSALMALGRTAEAITAYKVALSARITGADRGRVLNNLGTAYVAQGHYPDGEREFQAALALTRRALAPVDWSRIQHNRGSASLQQALADPRRPVARQQFHDAIEALELAREERPHDRLPLDRAITTANLAGAYVGLGMALHARRPEADRRSGGEHLRHALALYRAALPDLPPGDRASIERNVAITEEILRRLSGSPNSPSSAQWPTEGYTQAHRTRKETIIDYLTRVWLPLIEAGELDMRTLRARDPSAAKAVDNYQRKIDPVTGGRRRLPPHLHLPTQKEVNDRLAARFADPGERPVRLDWVMRARKRREMKG